MTLNEIILMLKETTLNAKSNNYIISGLNNEQIKEMLNIFSKSDSTVINYEDIKDEYIPNSDVIINVPIDLRKVEIKNIFNEIFSRIGINENLDFNNKLNILKFQRYLFEYDKIIRIILCNPSSISIDSQKLLNELLWFTSYAYNVCYLLNSKNEIKTMETTNGNMLDNRENYNQVKLFLQ